MAPHQSPGWPIQLGQFFDDGEWWGSRLASSFSRVAPLDQLEIPTGFLEVRTGLPLCWYLQMYLMIVPAKVAKPSLSRLMASMH